MNERARLVAALSVTQIVHWGSLYYAFAVLMPAMEGGLGLSRATMTGAFSASLLAQAATALVAGLAFDRFGSRACMTAGSVLAGIGLFLAARVEGVAGLYAVWMLIGVAAALTQYEAAFAAVTAVFAAEARRGISVLTFFGGLASTVFWPVTAGLLDWFGWRGALMVLAGLNAACLLLHAAFLPGPVARRAVVPGAPAADGHTLAQALRTRVFWLFAAALTLNGFLFGGLSAHIVPALVEKDIGPAALVLAACIGPMQTAGRVLEFVVGRHVSLRVVGLVALAASPVSLVFLALGQTVAWLIPFVVLYGASNGIMTIVRGAMPAELFGRARYGSIAGALTAPAALARAAGPVALGIAWGAAGGYALPVLGVAASAVLTLVFFAAAMRAAPRP